MGIGSASVMGVNLFRGGALVEGNESLEEVVASSVIVIATGVVREIISQR